MYFIEYNYAIIWKIFLIWLNKLKNWVKVIYEIDQKGC